MLKTTASDKQVPSSKNLTVTSIQDCNAAAGREVSKLIINLESLPKLMVTKGDKLVMNEIYAQQKQSTSSQPYLEKHVCIQTLTKQLNIFKSVLAQKNH